jgi:enamine deaminase RidA (YjgF/YER057c/UK114 family)
MENSYSFEKRMQELGLEIPALPQPVANYVPGLEAHGSLDRVERIVKLVAFVRCGADFMQQPQVANGVSDLLVEVFGEQGKHARSAVGVAALPGGMCFEAELILQVRSD